jgi:quercetin dioxygenase-like cupin family protein
MESGVIRHFRSGGELTIFFAVRAALSAAVAKQQKRSFPMKINSKGRALLSGVAAGIVGGVLSVGVANAGECPGGQMVMAGEGQQAGAAMPKGVTDNVLASIDLSKETIAVPDRQFRMRRLEVQPGGEVPWHSHEDRPAIIYIVSGEIVEYTDVCKVPILHKEGEVSVDAGRSHWWKNTGKDKAVLISADILHDKMDSNM